MDKWGNLFAWIFIYSFLISIVVWGLFSLTNLSFKNSIVKRKIKIYSLFVLIISSIYLAIVSSSYSHLNIPLVPNSNYVLSDQITFISSINSLVAFMTKHSFAITFLWCIGFMYNFYGFVIGLRRVRVLKATSEVSANEKLNTALEKIKNRLKLRRRVILMFSNTIKSPITTGFLKPIIYLPIGIMSHLSFYEFESIIQHEISHIKRSDYLINIILIIFESVFFFNPVILLLINDLRREMEYVCDDEVTKNYNSITYINSLLKLQENTITPKVVVSLAEKKTKEFRLRIERITNKKQKNRNNINQVVITSIMAIVLMGLFINSKHQKLNKEPVTITKNFELTNSNKTEENIDVTPKKIDATLSNKINLEIKDNEMLNKLLELGPVKTPDAFINEVHSELIKDGILNENRKKIVLMFQRSDIINGKKMLGIKYPKYKKIFTNHYPKFDSFATTKSFLLDQKS